jgi:hypothetical protein
MLKPMGLIMVTILFKLDEGLDQMVYVIYGGKGPFKSFKI